MAKKKGFWETLLGGTSGECSCDMKLTEETPKKKGGCCDMQIVEEDPKKKGGCCDMQIVEEADSEAVDDHKTTE